MNIGNLILPFLLLVKATLMVPRSSSKLSVSETWLSVHGMVSCSKLTEYYCLECVNLIERHLN